MDSETLILAGLLEAEGKAAGTSTSEMLRTLAEIAEGPTLWQTRQRQDLDEYRQRMRRRVARWRAPGVEPPELPDLSAFTNKADDKDLRVEVASLDDWARVTSVSRPHGIVSAYLRRRATADWRWSWPLRLGVLPSASADRWIAEAQGSGYHQQLYTVSENDGSAPCELLFIPADRADEQFNSAAIVVVMGLEPQHLPPDTVDAAMWLGPAGVVFCPGDSLAWVEHLVVELSHDAPLDLALAKAAPGAVLAVDPEFVTRTTVRQWGMELSTSLRGRGDTIGADRLDDLLSGRFASEGGEATESVLVSKEAAKAGIEAEIHGGPPRMSAAQPPHQQQQQQQQGRPERWETAAMQPPPSSPGATAAAPEPRPPAATPDRRRLQTIVRCAATAGAAAEVTDRFVAGAEHDIRVRIAAEVVRGAVRAARPFPHPEPGRDVTLDVSIIAAGKRTHRTLKLPAVKDSRWTTTVRFTAPPEAAEFAVYIEVHYQRRVIQSATLSGVPFSLSIDESEPAATAPARAAADGGLTILDGPHGSPTVLDLDVDAGSVNEAQIDAATRDLRKELLAAFVNPPASLADAAAPLTKLAVRGRILYDRLAGPTGEYHDADEWIHVNAFSKNDVPIELVYTHPMPSSDDSVPVCPEALAGATRCDKSCSHRNDAGVVCPFGFWATSKIIERRRHVRDRQNIVSALQRRLTPTQASVVGISHKADEADTTSSTRIIAALDQTVAAPVVAKSWQELEAAAASHPNLVVLVTHTIEPRGGNVLATSLELHGDVRAIHRIGDAAINPGRLQPGPVVLALGCDTNTVTAGFSDLVVNLHNARAEIVLSALSPIPGKGVADFLQRFMPLLKTSLATPGSHRFGAVMLAARRATIATGDLMALALSATGDAEVEISA